MVGSSNTDLVGRVPRLPRHGECLTGDSFSIGFGGKGANQAIMAARLGAYVTVVTRLGGDVFGDACSRHYRDEGVDTRHVVHDAARSSGVALILVDEPTGQNTIAFIPGANDALSPADVRRSVASIDGADVLLCQLEVPVETTLEAFRLAQGGGPPRPLTVLNAAPVPRKALPAELMELTDILVANEEEAAFLVGGQVASIEEAASAAALLASQWSCAVILTLGKLGVVHAEPERPAGYLPAPEVQPVDTTGAGDAFVGSLAVLLAIGDQLAVAAERAVSIASLTVLSHGSQASFPTRDEVRQRLGW
jgi:ribokinase